LPLFDFMSTSTIKTLISREPMDTALNFFKTKLRHNHYDLKTKFRSKSKCKHNSKTDGFIKKYLKNYQSTNNNVKDSVLMDMRRVVFVSLNGLYNSWKKCPIHVLYTSILLLPLKKDWIYNPSKYKTQLTPKVAESKPFMELLRWKDSQNLIFYMLDEHGPKVETEDDVFISPFWLKLSTHLETLYDNIHQIKYKKLIFDNKYWENRKKTQYKFNTNYESIIAELYFVTMKFDTMREIIFAANPSLNPVAYYGQESNTFKKISESKLLRDDIFNEEGDQQTDSEDNANDEWHISPDYDPYDIDPNPFTDPL